MEDVEWMVGQVVRLRDDPRRGVIVEIDPSLLVARLRVTSGGEMWCTTDQMMLDWESVQPVADSRRRG